MVGFDKDNFDWVTYCQNYLCRITSTLQQILLSMNRVQMVIIFWSVIISSKCFSLRTILSGPTYGPFWLSCLFWSKLLTPLFQLILLPSKNKDTTKMLDPRLSVFSNAQDYAKPSALITRKALHVFYKYSGFHLIALIRYIKI